MHIKELTVNNFRNYISERFVFNNEINIIYGGNAQGKTNILEAVLMCSCGRSHRTIKDSELTRIGERGYSIRTQAVSGEKRPEVKIVSKRGEKKRIEINGIPAARMGELMGVISAVMFSPEDLSIVKRGPGERRRFADMTISRIRPAYFYALQKYKRVLAQRNSLLKEMSSNRLAASTLEVWNRAIAETGARILIERKMFTNKITGRAKERHSMITRGKEEMELIYMPSFSMEGCEERKDIEREFEKRVEGSFEQEVRYGTSLYGPHRDDWNVTVDGTDVREYGSQGQQRTAVLALKFAEMDIVKEDTGESPVLLLDDVMSELDSQRREYLIESMENIQVLLTSTEKETGEQIPGRRIKYIKIKEGRIEKETN